MKKKREVDYEILKSKDNMLARGQNAILNDSDNYENIELNPGEACIFGQDAVHGSGENQSSEDVVVKTRVVGFVCWKTISDSL